MGDPGSLLWEPTPEVIESSNVFDFLRWLRRNKGVELEDYEQLHQWSVDYLEDFWEAVVKYFDIQFTNPYTRVLAGSSMPGADWFSGAKLNYAQHLLRFEIGKSDSTAIHEFSEARGKASYSWSRLGDDSRMLAQRLRQLGICQGDRVVSYLPNIYETLVAFIATASVGAIWSSSSPDLGSRSVLDRFRQTKPKMMFFADGYVYGGKTFGRMEEAKTILQELDTLEISVFVSYLGGRVDAEFPAGVVTWDELLESDSRISDSFEFEQVSFSHPLWIVYSSGTTGVPKAMVHSHGGITLELTKLMAFHMNLKPGSCMLFFTTTGWIMWNLLTAALLQGASIVLFDGNPTSPDPSILWKIAEETGTSLFGSSPGYIEIMREDNISPMREHELSTIDTVVVSGAPATAGVMAWCYENIKPSGDLWLTSLSGGTDVASAFVGGSPMLRVRAGEIQTRCLGVDVHALDEQGNKLIDKAGEMVISQPMPSMPVHFWNDENGERYRSSYFEFYPGKWCHGDLLIVTNHGACVLCGRSDATLNRGGVRIGTAEIYRCIELVESIADSIVVQINDEIWLFVQMKEGIPFDASVKQQILSQVRKAYSPRHVPDLIKEIGDIPYTLTGKKMEVPVRKVLMGGDPAKVVALDAVRNPEAMHLFSRYSVDSTPDTD